MRGNFFSAWFVVSRLLSHSGASKLAYPINRIASCEPSPCEILVVFCFLCSVIPAFASDCMDGVELGEAAGIRAPSKVIDDEALYSSSFCGIDKGLLEWDAAWSNDTDNGVLVVEGFRQSFKRVLCSDCANVWRMKCC